MADSSLAILHRAGPLTTAEAACAPPMRPTTDIHQHLWPEELLAALSRRAGAPRLVRQGGVWELSARGEPACVVDPADHDPVRRADHAAADGIERIVIAPSCPVGIEALSEGEAAPLLDAYHIGVARLGTPFRAWAAASLADPDPQLLGACLSDGFVGLCLPAGAFAGPGQTWVVAPLLEVLTARSAPLLIHPGPAPWDAAPDAPLAAPGWWPALTTYVHQMHQAWFVVNRFVRPDFPALRICFAMLGGLAPLHADRLRSRGGGVVGDRVTFVETSSYGPGVTAAVAAVIGDEAIVFGSDRPVVDAVPAVIPGAPAARDNAARLIDGEVGQ
jgi:hypothetical protein